MELRQFRYFTAVAEEGTFTRAARRLHVSQPPVSRQIALLEAELGVRLFERTRQRAQLTDAGRAFYEQARVALRSVESAAIAARRAAQGEVGRLALGFGGSVAYLLPDVVAEFRRRYRAVELVLQPLNIAEQYDALLRDTIDFGLLTEPVEHDALQTEAFRREPLMAVLPPDHPLCQRRRVRLDDLAPLEFVMFPWTRGRGFGHVIMRVCSRAGFVPHVVQEAWPTESILAMVGAGVGVSILPAMAQRQHVSAVAYRPIADGFAFVDIVMAWKKANRSQSLRRFIEVARISRDAQGLAATLRPRKRGAA